MRTEDTVISVIARRFEISEAKLNEKTAMRDIGADSLDMVDMITELEELFSVNVSDDEINDMRTVGDVIKCIEEKL